MASKLEKMTSMKRYPGITDLKFNRTYNKILRKEMNRVTNRVGEKGVKLSRREANSVLVRGTYSFKVVANRGVNKAVNSVR